MANPETYSIRTQALPEYGRGQTVAAIYANIRHGKVARQYVRPRNPRTPEQQGIWIRTCQHIDGYADVPKVTRARVPAATP